MGIASMRHVRLDWTVSWCVCPPDRRILPRLGARRQRSFGSWRVCPPEEVDGWEVAGGGLRPIGSLLAFLVQT